MAKFGLRGAVKRGPENLLSNTVHVGVKKGNRNLLELINKGLASLAEDELAAVDALWISNPADRFYRKATEKLVLAEEEKQWIKDNPTIRFAVTNFISPVDIVDDKGNYSGLNADLIALLNRKAGTNIVPEFYGKWQDVVKSALTGNVDGVLSFSRTKEREKQILYTQPYAFDPIVIVTTEGNKSIQSSSDIEGKSVAVVKGLAFIDQVKTDIGAGTLQTFDSEYEALIAVKNGTVDAHVTTQFMFTNSQNERFIDQLKIATSKNSEGGSLRIGINKKNPVLFSIVQSALDSITLAELNELRQKWLFPSSSAKSRSQVLVELSAEENKWVKDNPILRVASEMDWPPFDFVEDGKPVGLSIEIIKQAAANVGLELDFINGFTWKELMAKFRAGELDILPALFATEDRRKIISFSEPYASNPSVMVVHQEENNISVLSDLYGQKIASINGYSTQLQIKKLHPKIQHLEVESTLEGLKTVSFKKAKAFIGSLGTISYIVENNLIPNIRIVGDSGLMKEDQVQLRMGVLKDNQIILDVLQKGLDAITKKEMARMRKPWLSFTYAPTKGTPLVELSADEKKWLRNNQSFSLGVDPAWAPFEFVGDDGRHKGIASGYVDEVNKRLNITMKPLAGLSWPEVIEKAKVGEVDVLPAVARTTEREKYLNFTKPYVSFPMVISTRKDAPFVDNVSALEGMRVGVVKGYFSQDIMEEHHPEISLVTFNTLAEGLEAVEGKKVDAFLDNLATITYEIDRLKLDDLKIASATKYNFDLSMAVRKDLPELVVLIDKALETITEKERNAIKNTWIAIRVNLGTSLKTILTWAIPIAGGALFIIVGIIYWNRKLGIAKKKADDRLAELKIVMDTIRYGVVFVDENLNCRLVNQAFREMWGLPDELVAQQATIPELIRFNRHNDIYGVADEDFDAFVDDRVARIKAGAVPQTEVKLQNGKTYLYQCSVLPDGGRMLSYFDLTAQKAIEERIRSIIENAVDGIITIDTKGIVESFSPAAERIFGYVADEVIGQNVTMLMPEHYRADHGGHIQRYLTTSEARIVGTNREVVGLRKDGTEFAMDLAVGETLSGEQHLFTGIVRDISARKEAEQALEVSEERTRLLLASVGEGVFGVNLDGEITFVNPPAEEMLGYSAEEMIGEKAHPLFHHHRPDGSHYPVEECWMFRSFTYGETHRIDDEVLWRKDGTPLEIEYNSTPIRKEDEIIGAVISFMDISERKEAERKLQDAYEIISGSIEYASNIQHSALPDHRLLVPLTSDYFVWWEPRDVVGGDLYWVGAWGDGCLIILGDCTGHGVPGAFMTLISISAIERAVAEIPGGDVGKLITRAHQYIQVMLGQHYDGGNSDDGIELGACFFVPEEPQMKFAAARFNLLITDDEDTQVIKGTKAGMGYRNVPYVQEYKEETIDLKEGQYFYMTSDGLTDQIGGERRRMFGKKRLLKLLQENRDLTMEAQMQLLQESLAEYQGDERRRDDISMIGFKF